MQDDWQREISSKFTELQAEKEHDLFERERMQQIQEKSLTRREQALMERELELVEREIGVLINQQNLNRPAIKPRRRPPWLFGPRTVMDISEPSNPEHHITVIGEQPSPDSPFGKMVVTDVSQHEAQRLKKDRQEGGGRREENVTRGLYLSALCATIPLGFDISGVVTQPSTRSPSTINSGNIRNNPAAVTVPMSAESLANHAISLGSHVNERGDVRIKSTFIRANRPTIDYNRNNVGGAGVQHDRNHVFNKTMTSQGTSVRQFHPLDASLSYQSKYSTTGDVTLSRSQPNLASGGKMSVPGLGGVGGAERPSTLDIVTHYGKGQLEHTPPGVKNYSLGERNAFKEIVNPRVTTYSTLSMNKASNLTKSPPTFSLDNILGESTFNNNNQTPNTAYSQHTPNLTNNPIPNDSNYPTLSLTPSFQSPRYRIESTPTKQTIVIISNGSASVVQGSSIGYTSNTSSPVSVPLNVMPLANPFLPSRATTTPSSLWPTPVSDLQYSTPVSNFSNPAVYSPVSATNSPVSSLLLRIPEAAQSQPTAVHTPNSSMENSYPPHSVMQIPRPSTHTAVGTLSPISETQSLISPTRSAGSSIKTPNSPTQSPFSPTQSPFSPTQSPRSAIQSSIPFTQSPPLAKIQSQISSIPFTNSKPVFSPTSPISSQISSVQSPISSLQSQISHVHTRVSPIQSSVSPIPSPVSPIPSPISLTQSPVSPIHSASPRNPSFTRLSSSQAQLSYVSSEERPPSSSPLQVASTATRRMREIPKNPPISRFSSSPRDNTTLLANKQSNSVLRSNSVDSLLNGPSPAIIHEGIQQVVISELSPLINLAEQDKTDEQKVSVANLRKLFQQAR